MTGKGDLIDLVLFIGGMCLVLSAAAIAVCAVMALRFCVEERCARRRPAPACPVESVCDLFGDLSWESGDVVGIDRARARRIAREAERDGC